MVKIVVPAAQVTFVVRTSGVPGQPKDIPTICYCGVDATAGSPINCLN